MSTAFRAGSTLVGIPLLKLVLILLLRRATVRRGRSTPLDIIEPPIILARYSSIIIKLIVTVKITLALGLALSWL